MKGLEGCQRLGAGRGVEGRQTLAPVRAPWVWDQGRLSDSGCQLGILNNFIPGFGSCTRV